MKAVKSVKSKPMTPSWDLVNPNFRLIREHYLGLMYLVILPGLVYTLGAVLLRDIQVVNNELVFRPIHKYGIALMVIGGLWTLFNIGPITVFALRGAAGKTNTLREYYQAGLRYNLKLLYCYVATGLIIFFGLLLLIVPGLIAIRRYYLAPYYVVDQNLDVMDALRQSAADSKPASKAIWGVLGVQLVFVLAAYFLGLIPLIGIVLSQLFAYTTFFLAVLRYKEIRPVSKKAKA